MDETKARALVATWEHGDEAHRQWLRDTAIPGLLAFAAEVRRDERERALVAVLRLTADDIAKYGGRQAAIDAIRALSDAPGGPDPTVALEVWRNQCGVCDGVFDHPEALAENPYPNGTFCPQCQRRGLKAPGVLHFAPLPRTEAP